MIRLPRHIDGSALARHGDRRVARARYRPPRMFRQARHLPPAPGHYSAPAADPEEQVGRAPKLGRTAIGCTDMHCRLTWLTE